MTTFFFSSQLCVVVQGEQLNRWKALGVTFHDSKTAISVLSPNVSVGIHTRIEIKPEQEVMYVWRPPRSYHRYI